MYTVVIVEDDPIITSLNRRYTEKDNRFRVLQTFTAARPALSWLRRHVADLVILDFYIPQMNGLELLHEMRAAGVRADVIMITAANDAPTVEALMRLGVVDYLVKPFAYERFQQALASFCERREAIRGGSVSQDALDRILHGAPSAFTPPKGFQLQTLQHIQDYLRETPLKAHTCEEIASQVGLSTVTVRHYMNYLVEHCNIVSDMNYGTGGRPCLLYRCKTECE